MILNIFYIVFSLLYFICFLVLFCSFFFKMLIPLIFKGAFYAPSQDEQINKIVEFAQGKQGEKAVDLGSGDGRIVIALAKKGIETHGYEINPILVWKANQNIKRTGLQEKAFMHWGNFWNKDLSCFDIITVYGISFAMGALEKKLKRELKSNARIISNYFCFPTWLPVKKENGVYLYKK